MEELTATLRGLLQATDELVAGGLPRTDIDQIIARGELRPAEDEALGFWFARYLSVRDTLWEVIEDVLDLLDKPMKEIKGERDWKYFLVGYAACCLLIRIDRFLLFKLARHTIIQRKLNEAFPEYRIPRKQYTRIFSAYVNRRHALLIYDAMRLVKKNADLLTSLRNDPDVGFLASRIDELESYLDPSKRNYVWRLLAYISHKWRRRGVVSLTKTLAKVLEGFGRTASEINFQSTKRVTPEVRKNAAGFLKPGDIIVTRHDRALTNLFLPGFWPHAALYIGRPDDRRHYGIEIDWAREQRWKDNRCVLEALKDGVRFRPLDETLAVDNFAILRPTLSDTNIARAIERAVQHEGKMYNFDFDFFNSERLVCTEVIYRAYDGLEELQIPLIERANRKTLSAEDLLDFALTSDQLTPIAIFGVKGCENSCVQGEAVRELLIGSYPGGGSISVGG